MIKARREKANPRREIEWDGEQSTETHQKERENIDSKGLPESGSPQVRTEPHGDVEKGRSQIKEEVEGNGEKRKKG